MRIVRAAAGLALRPLVFCLVLTGAGIVLHRPWLSGAGVLLLWCLSTPTLSGLLIGALEKRFPALPIIAAPRADAVVVIGGNIIRGLDASGIHWGPSVNRFSDAVRLLHAGKAPLLILTAADCPYDSTRSQGAILADAAVDDGIPREAILMTGRIANSAEEVRAIAELCDQRGIRSAIVVTSAWHMPRIKLLFERTRLPVCPFPVDRRANMRGWIPAARALAGSEAAIHEWAALAWSRLT